MNKYPGWLNALVLIVLLAGILFAAPNLYERVPAVQISDRGNVGVDAARLDEFVRIFENNGVEPEAAFIQDGRAVLRFDPETVKDKTLPIEALKNRLGNDANVAQTMAPKVPAWMRSLNLGPMSLGLDLRGGVYVLLEVDMAEAVTKRLESYQQDIGRSTAYGKDWSSGRPERNCYHCQTANR